MVDALVTLIYVGLEAKYWLYALVILNTARLDWLAKSPFCSPQLLKKTLHMAAPYQSHKNK